MAFFGASFSYPLYHDIYADKDVLGNIKCGVTSVYITERSVSHSNPLQSFTPFLLILYFLPLIQTPMSSWLSYITGKKETKVAARDAIVTLRQQLTMLEKKEDFLKKKIDEEAKIAKVNAVNNKSGIKVLVQY